MELGSDKERQKYHNEVADAKADVLKASANIVRTALSSMPEMSQRVARALDIVLNHAENPSSSQSFSANPRQRQQFVALLWDQLPQVRGNSSLRQTAWGVKSQSGLVECLETIINDKRGQ